MPLYVPNLSITSHVPPLSALYFYTYRNLNIFIYYPNQQSCINEIAITSPPASWNRCLLVCAALSEPAILSWYIQVLASQSSYQMSTKRDHRRCLKESTIVLISFNQRLSYHR